MRIRHRGGEDSNLIFRRKVVLHSGVRLGRVGCSQQGICRGDRAHEDAAGSAVDVDEAFAADGGADEGFGGALYGEIKVGGLAGGGAHSFCSCNTPPWQSSARRWNPGDIP